jgi:hypothetical protein
LSCGRKGNNAAPPLKRYAQLLEPFAFAVAPIAARLNLQFEFYRAVFLFFFSKFQATIACSWSRLCTGCSSPPTLPSRLAASRRGPKHRIFK